MTSLHLEKSKVLLHGRLQFVRFRLLGQTFPRVRNIPQLKVGKKLVSEAYALAKKYADQPQKPIFAFPDVQRLEEPFQPSFIPEKVKVVHRGSWRTAFFAVTMGLSFLLLAVLFVPTLYFRFFSHEIVPVQATEEGTPLGGTFAPPVQEQRQLQLPPQEESLPEGNRLFIPRIGVNTEILESEVPEESLAKGVWRVPDFAQPQDTTLPMILAAHRYGYNWWWKGEYWKYHSFYLLPELEPGDLVEVISDKRKYLYEIYAGEEGSEITDYNADLILYTCKFLNSEIRHFRYARRIDPAKYSEYETVVASPSAQLAQ
jgi:sortase (surface protein transpeptidase)